MYPTKTGLTSSAGGPSTRRQAWDKGEPIRKFAGRVRSLAAVSNYSLKCSKDGCNTTVSYTEAVIIDHLIMGLADLEIQKDVLSHAEADKMDLEKLLKFIEGKILQMLGIRTLLSPMLELSMMTSLLLSSRMRLEQKTLITRLSCLELGMKTVLMRARSPVSHCMIIKAGKSWRKRLADGEDLPL